MKIGIYYKLDNALCPWFRLQCEKGIPVTGLILLQKALNFTAFSTLKVLCVVFLFVSVPFSSTLRIQLYGFFAYPFRFFKVLSQLNRIIEEAFYKNLAYRSSSAKME